MTVFPLPLVTFLDRNAVGDQYSATKDANLKTCLKQAGSENSQGRTPQFAECLADKHLLRKFWMMGQTLLTERRGQGSVLQADTEKKRAT